MAAPAGLPQVVASWLFPFRALLRELLPRACGADRIQCCHLFSWSGAFPQAPGGRRSSSSARRIPACAGKPPRRSGASRSTRVHPRACAVADGAGRGLPAVGNPLRRGSHRARRPLSAGLQLSAAPCRSQLFVLQDGGAQRCTSRRHRVASLRMLNWVFRRPAALAFWIACGTGLGIGRREAGCHAGQHEPRGSAQCEQVSLSSQVRSLSLLYMLVAGTMPHATRAPPPPSGEGVSE